MEGVEKIVAQLWPERRVSLEALEGGLVNQNVLATLEDGRRFVIRLGGTATDVLGIDRHVEHEASLAAAAVGVGPAVEAFLEPEQCLVTRYIDGAPVAPERMREPSTIRRVALALRAFHNGPPLPARFSSFEKVEEYRSTAFAHGSSMPAAYAWARQLARRIQIARGAAAERPCHNDLLNGNFVDDGSRIRIVDWEDAGMGDVFFDLANLAVNHDFGEAEHEALLTAYVGKVREQDLRALHLMRFMSDFREAMWGVVQAAVSPSAFDFQAYVEAHFARLERTAESPAFLAALAG